MIEYYNADGGPPVWFERSEWFVSKDGRQVKCVARGESPKQVYELLDKLETYAGKSNYNHYDPEIVFTGGLAMVLSPEEIKSQRTERERDSELKRMSEN